ncbi:MAG: hypothetical protein AAF990_05885 [Bacteroidota bacterium]
MNQFLRRCLYPLWVCILTIGNQLVAQEDPILMASNIELKAVYEKCDVWVNFEASSKDDQLRYGIEWSTDGKKFETLKSIKSYGHDVSQSVSYRHRNPANLNYYRLKLLAGKGKVGYTQAVEVAPACEGERGDLYLFPNPVRPAEGMLYIRLFRNGEGVKLRLRSKGSDLKRFFNLPTETGWNILRLDLSELPPGTYFLNDVDQVKGRIYKFKIAE